jgi:hypothetical protein
VKNSQPERFDQSAFGSIQIIVLQPILAQQIPSLGFQADVLLYAGGFDPLDVESCRLGIMPSRTKTGQRQQHLSLVARRSDSSGGCARLFRGTYR